MLGTECFLSYGNGKVRLRIEVAGTGEVKHGHAHQVMRMHKLEGSVDSPFDQAWWQSERPRSRKNCSIVTNLSVFCQFLTILI